MVNVLHVSYILFVMLLSQLPFASAQGDHPGQLSAVRCHCPFAEANLVFRHKKPGGKFMRRALLFRANKLLLPYFTDHHVFPARYLMK